MIKFLLLESLKLLIFMMCAVIIGLIIPFMIATLLVLTTELSYKQCIISVPFGWTSVILTIDAFRYLNRMIEKYNNMIHQEELNKQKQQNKQDGNTIGNHDDCSL